MLGPRPGMGLEECLRCEQDKVFSLEIERGGSGRGRRTTGPFIFFAYTKGFREAISVDPPNTPAWRI